MKLSTTATFNVTVFNSFVTVQVSELHSALASVHAELQVANREGELFAETRNKLTRDLSKAEARADKGEAAAETAETR
jgi:hypothetical protein